MSKKLISASSIPGANFAVTEEGHLKYIGTGKSNVTHVRDDYSGQQSWHETSYPKTTTSFGSDKYNCDHKPNVGCKVGNFTLYPTADKFMTSSTVDLFDVLTPLVDSGFSITSIVEEYLGLLMWFPIKDMTAPNPAKLRVMAQRINDFARGGARVAFWCIGSHGRTGTVLATCIGLEEPDVDPIDEVRKRHCKHAVETYPQLQAVFEALGRELPEKWKKTPLKTTENYNYQGWRDSLPPLASTIKNNWDTQCEYCNVKDKMFGVYPHYGTPKDIYAHIDCWEKYKIEKAKKLNQTIVDVSDVTQPTGVVADPVIDQEQYKELVKESRPFWKDWNAHEMAQFEHYYNAIDSFTDFICPDCKRLIIDPEPARLTIVKEANGVTVKHSNCAEWADDDDCNVLCTECLEIDVSQLAAKICATCATDGK